MGKAEGSFPSVHDTTTLWQWVKKINKATGSDLYNGYCLETGTKDLLYTEDSVMHDSKQHFGARTGHSLLAPIM